MTPERWQKIESVFQTAVELSPKDRSAYVDIACAGDKELRSEVEKLLRSFDAADKLGDEVIVFGPELPLTQIAEWSGTITYEIMTGISQRVKRVYFHE